MANVDKELLYTSLGAAMKQARKDFKTETGGKLSQKDLANKLGIKRTSITNIEAGNQNPPLHLIYEIALILNIPLKDILPTVSEVLLNSVEKVTLDNKEILVPNKIASYIESFTNKETKS